MSKEIEKEINDLIKEMDRARHVYKYKLEVLADKGRTTACIGEYGSGETYYSEGYIEDQKASGHPDDVVQYYFGDDPYYEAGTWVSSSDMC